MTFEEFLEDMSRDWIEQRLKALLRNVRDLHSYCFYCGSVYENAEQLDLLCPGLWEDDH